MSEIIFEIVEDPTGGYNATALGYGIHTEGETYEELKQQIRDAVECYFDDHSSAKPRIIRLHLVRDEVMAV